MDKAEILTSYCSLKQTSVALPEKVSLAMLPIFLLYSVSLVLEVEGELSGAGNVERPAVIRRNAVLLYSLRMLAGGVSFVRFPVVNEILLVDFHHVIVTESLRQN